MKTIQTFKKPFLKDGIFNSIPFKKETSEALLSSPQGLKKGLKSRKINPNHP